MAWTLTPTLVERSKNYLKWKVRCVSDASALSATDLFAEGTMDRDLRAMFQGLTYMRMKIDPVPDGVNLETTLNVTLSDSEGDALYTTTGNSISAISWHDLSTDISAYPVVLNRLYLTCNDLGAAGNTFDLYFICWKEAGSR